MKSNKLVKVFIPIFVCMLGMSVLISSREINAEDLQFTKYRIEGKGIILTQEEAKTLTDDEVLEKAEFKAYDAETSQEVDVTFKLDAISFDRFNVSSSGEVGVFGIIIQEDGKEDTIPGTLGKIVVLGDSIVNVGVGDEPNLGDSYVKINKTNYELSYDEYLNIIEYLNRNSKDGLHTKEELFSLLLSGSQIADGSNIIFTPLPYYTMFFMNSWVMPDMLIEIYALDPNNQIEFDRFMNFDYKGGEVSLEFKFINGISYKPTLTFKVLPGEASKEIKPVKPAAPSTGDNTNTPLLASLLITSGLIAIYKVKRKEN